NDPRFGRFLLRPDLFAAGFKPGGFFHFVLVVHATAFSRSALSSSNVRPAPSRVAFRPLSVCQRCKITSTYFGSNSIPQQTRSVSSAAASVVPLPRKGS